MRFTRQEALSRLVTVKLARDGARGAAGSELVLPAPQAAALVKRGEARPRDQIDGIWIALVDDHRFADSGGVQMIWRRR